ncbi:serine/threonine protein kinase [Tieghemiomyces parasiticus]|uniref:non-specific serine/threonine protein kinase n=1 Tax=Tieghemiomyces parasiticus TaxID=78921 RepID=A0A9W7ZLM6_9FUNG|nr:serine/threonine protein kinase [Tieghemiomyces parasiticus]
MASPRPDPAAAAPGSQAKRTVRDFTFGRILGEGSYSTVMLGTDQTTGQQYAVKILDKRHIIKEKKTKYVNIERNTLNRLNHPLVVRLHFAFQDPTSLYFVLDYAEHGELLTLIRRCGQLPEVNARFYLAEIVTAVEYLHSRGVVHRDLKPENILLDQDMHIKLTDFGTAKLTDSADAGPPRANSFVGTAEYVSPELLTDKAVDRRSDLWALGCILYQLLSGRLPFKGANDYQTFQQIIRHEYTIPDDFSPAARDLVTQLLAANPADRIGAAGPDLAAVKAHPFFSGLDWRDLHLQVPPPLPAPSPPVGPWNGTANDDDEDLIDDSDLFQRLQALPVYEGGSALPADLGSYTLPRPSSSDPPTVSAASPPLRSPPRLVTTPPQPYTMPSYYDPHPSQSGLSYSSTQSPPDPHFHNLHHTELALHEGGKLSQSAQPWTWRGRLALRLSSLCPCICGSRP